MKTTTQILNNLYSLVCVLCAVWAEMPPAALDVLPAPWKHYVTVGAMAAMWIKGHYNLFITPNGAKLQQFVNVGSQRLRGFRPFQLRSRFRLTPRWRSENAVVAVHAAFLCNDALGIVQARMAPTPRVSIARRWRDRPWSMALAHIQ